MLSPTVGALLRVHFIYLILIKLCNKIYFETLIAIYSKTKTQTVSIALDYTIAIVKYV